MQPVKAGSIRQQLLAGGGFLARHLFEGPLAEIWIMSTFVPMNEIKETALEWIREYTIAG